MALFSVAQGSHRGKTQRDVNSGDLTLDLQFAIQLRTKYTPGASAGEFAPRLLSGRTRQVVLTASLCSRVEWKDPRAIPNTAPGGLW
jgi:hypothetical protein